MNADADTEQDIADSIAAQRSRQRRSSESDRDV